MGTRTRYFLVGSYICSYICSSYGPYVVLKMCLLELIYLHFLLLCRFRKNSDADSNATNDGYVHANSINRRVKRKRSTAPAIFSNIHLNNFKFVFFFLTSFFFLWKDIFIASHVIVRLCACLCRNIAKRALGKDERMKPSAVWNFLSNLGRQNSVRVQVTVVTHLVNLKFMLP